MPLDESISGGQSGHLVDHETIHRFVNADQNPAYTSRKEYYCSPDGSDAYDGLSKRWPKATIPAVIALGSGAVEGEFYFGPGNHTPSDTVHIGSSMRLHGVQGETSAGHGTEWTWSGADDGRPMVITDSTSDYSHGLIENIRFTGTSNMLGGGICLALRNPQNGTIIRNCMVRLWPIGVKMYDSTATGVNNPGYVRLEQVWADQCKLTGFWIEAGTTGIVLDTCASDPSGAATSAYYLTMKDYAASPAAITSSSQSGTTGTYNTTAVHGIADANRFVEIAGVDVAGYNGIYRINSITDTDTFTVSNMDQTGLGAGSGGTFQAKRAGGRGEVTFINCKTEHYESTIIPTWVIEGIQRVNLIGCCSRFPSTTGSSMISWLGPSNDEAAANAPLNTPRLHAIGCAAQNYTNLLSAPRFGLTIVAPQPNGGRAVPFDFIPQAYSPILDFQEITDPLAPQSNQGRLFARDNGSGKTQLCVRFATGAIQVVATEP